MFGSFSWRFLKTIPQKAEKPMGQQKARRIFS
jgi:hypothetical protein